MDKRISTILVVEDEAMLLLAISKKLELSGLNPVTAVSGEQALDYLENLTELPDVIWLDYNLKTMSGLEFLKKVKENKLWAKIPVVIVSNSASEDKVHNMLALGAQKYILKAEYRLDDIISVVKEFVPKIK